MTDNTLPDEPSRRKIMMVLKPEDIEALRFDEDGPDLLLNEEVHILSSQPSKPDPDVQHLIDQGLVKSGAVLVQNPFDKSLYQDKSEAVEQFALDKYLHFSTLCGLLGAREVEIKQIRRKKGKREATLSIEGGVPKVGVEGSRDSKELESFRSQLTLKDEFEGGEPEVKAATELLQRTGLSGDANMRGLLNIFQGQNIKIKSRTLELNLTTEVHRNLKILANLKVPKFLASLEADYDSKVQEQTEYTLNITVNF